MTRLFILCCLLAGIAFAGAVRWKYDADGSVQITGDVCAEDRELVQDLKHEIERLHAENIGIRAAYRARRIRR